MKFKRNYNNSQYNFVFLYLALLLNFSGYFVLSVKTQLQDRKQQPASKSKSNRIRGCWMLIHPFEIKTFRKMSLNTFYKLIAHRLEPTVFSHSQFSSCTFFKIYWFKSWVTFIVPGFGDLVPSGSMDQKSQEKLTFCSVYLLVGMALIAMCFKLMQVIVTSWYLINKGDIIWKVTISLHNLEPNILKWHIFVKLGVVWWDSQWSCWKCDF